ncbi:Tfp pilus assembly protein PilW [Variovorax sp. PBS-H4]|nr:Tfp pilus assembly protein PilW [Variovorax sp. PBS-H4]
MKGRTLLELMIAITIGIVILGALIAVYLATGASSRQTTAVSRMNEDAAIAFSLMSSQLRMAGFSIPRKGVVPGAATVDGVSVSLPDRKFIGAGIRACDHGFTSSTVAFNALACATGSTGAAAFAVRFEGADPAGTADDFRFLVPANLDCLGQAVGDDAAELSTDAEGALYPLVESRFTVGANGSSGTSDLSCIGNGNAFARSQPMVQNVADMRLRFGVAANGTSSDVVQYLDSAADVDALGASADQNWSRVVTVRLCLLMRGASASPADAGTSYVDCDGNPTSSSDGFSRRSYVQTIALRNRGGIAGMAP